METVTVSRVEATSLNRREVVTCRSLSRNNRAVDSRLSSSRVGILAGAGMHLRPSHAAVMAVVSPHRAAVMAAAFRVLGAAVAGTVAAVVEEAAETAVRAAVATVIAD